MLTSPRKTDAQSFIKVCYHTHDFKEVYMFYTKNTAWPDFKHKVALKRICSLQKSERERQTETDRQKRRQKHPQTDGRTDRQTETERERERVKKREEEEDKWRGFARNLTTYCQIKPMASFCHSLNLRFSNPLRNETTTKNIFRK